MEELPEGEWNGIGTSKEFFVMAIADFGAMVVAPYAIPTVVRIYTELGKPNKNQEEIIEAPREGLESRVNLCERFGAELGAGAGFFLNIGQVMGYYTAVSEGREGMLLIPLVTNVASGIYELARYFRMRKEENAKQIVQGD